MKLKPCPFCGGEADTLCAVGFFAVPINKVYCMECGALVEGYSNEVDAIEAWNRREPIEYIIEQLKVWRDTSLDSLEQCAYIKAIEIVKSGGKA